jgi:membrane peptidoglycan carboxypeptidase
VSFAAVQQSSTVYFSNGKTEVGTFTANGIDRQMLTSSQIPAVMNNAIIAAEDRHFYSEGGISVSGIVRSAYEDLKGGGNLQGGSTLTEQFVKNYYSTIGMSRTVSSKLKEIFISIKLSHEESKGWILTQYLNAVPFGDNAYGIGAAAQIYFNEPAMKLTIAQSAMLAAMVNQPSNFSPDPKAGAAYQALFARWQYVLTNMVRDGAITQAEANAQKFPTVVQGQGLAASWNGYRGYIMQAVENELEDTYGYTQNQIDTGGLKVVTTFNLHMMNGLYRAVNQNLREMKAEGQGLPSYAHVGALLEQPGTGAILAEYGGPSYSAPNCAKIDCQYNMASESRNLVGSSFKPYVLATAVKEGMDVQNSVLNAIEPMCVPPMSQPMTFSTETTICPAGWWSVNIQGENYNRGIPVAYAAAVSSDPAFEDLIHRTGGQATINVARAFGVNISASGLERYKDEVGMALGIASLTVEEQATTFATLAADGEYATPHVIQQITQNGNNVPLKITHRQVLTPAQAADVDYALSFDVNCNSGACGTAAEQGQLDPNRPTIGKTGTTDQAQSAFFIGAIPQYSLGIGMFTNSQNEKPGGQTLNILPTLVGNQTGGYGGAWPTAIWRTYMQNLTTNLPILQLPTPDYFGFSKWDQVPVQHKKPKHQQQNPNPGQKPCPPFEQRLNLCPGGGNPNPNPSPTPSPSPSPTPSPTPSNHQPFGGADGQTIAAVPLAEDPTTTVVRPLGSG